MRKFAIIFVLLLVLQVLLIFFGAGLSIGGRPPLVIYSPIIELLLPMLTRHFGGGDGSLGPVIVWGSLAGALIYSIVLAGLVAFAAAARWPSRGPDV
jgi:hypothetical protein